MAKRLSYADAVRLLGGRENKAVAALDKLTGGALLASSALGAGFALSLLGPKSELARLSGGLLSGLSERLSGLSRFERSERLAAAHAVVVLTAFFEALEAADLPFDGKALELTKAEQGMLATGRSWASSRLTALVTDLLHFTVPMPDPARPYEATLAELRAFFESVSRSLHRFVRGLAIWDDLDETRRERFDAVLRSTVGDLALARYEELFRRLGTDFPEFAFWANSVDHQATRARIEAMSRGLAGLERVLTEFATGRAPDERRRALATAYRAALDRPVLASGDVPEGLRLPRLGEAYVNPDFRITPVESADLLAEESWWHERPVRQDLQGFLAGQLTSPRATEAPLLVLGQPGSGKSMLTQVLAARLPPGDFLAVRVALRDVPADTDVQRQIEHAIRAATGESLTWPELARTAGGALPVVLLDGFDELLQATGVSQSDYLEKVADFQRREADLGRPVAVVVTSRVAVADRARPVWGMVAIRLEPFRETQIAQWLQVWNAANAAELEARGVKPLPVEPVLEHGELAAQPLLLLMLALYDADGNALQRGEAALGRTELYERLLTRFAEREVRKTAPGLSEVDFRREVERELTRLSVVAFAMFNRNRQWVTEAELDADLPLLLGGPSGRRDRTELTAAQIVIGRFFFVHEAQATHDESRLRTYEFLHATFGEFLLGRLVARELGVLAETAALTATRGRPAPPDDEFLHALLSFVPLTVRGTAISFLADRLTALPSRDVLRGLLLELFHHALGPRTSQTFDGYRPRRIGVPQRHAAYAANLLLLIVLTGGEVSGAELFPGHRDPVEGWHRMALLWRSQLPAQGWNRLVHTFELRREWTEDDQPEIQLSFAREETTPPKIDPSWSYGTSLRGEAGWRHFDFGDLRAHNHFLCDRADDTIMHALEPLAGRLDSAVSAFSRDKRGIASSSANSLFVLWLTANRDDATTEELVDAYERCLETILHGPDAKLSGDERRFASYVFRQLAADSERLPLDWWRRTMNRIWEAAERDRSLRRLGRGLPERS
ncbi:NACHT domain-containing protein [Amycolatopsis anabasis]|uniref:NACHT domain-containing protein n=1 Tax=Amycolatopsis anabasis TaxID=1840409 RepID=UPI00131BC69D|nr:hypothetical protein [Amycolatopsis anabasis]